jgi:hypothetical protein
VIPIRRGAGDRAEHDGLAHAEGPRPRRPRPADVAGRDAILEDG